MSSSTPSKWRDFIWRTYAFGEHVECCHCRVYLNYQEFTVDHLLPRALGGRNSIWNLLPACLACNSSRPCEDVQKQFLPYITAIVGRGPKTAHLRAKMPKPGRPRCRIARYKQRSAGTRRSLVKKKPAKPNVWYVPNPPFSFQYQA